MKLVFAITANAFIAAGGNARAENGKVVMTKRCAKCHGDDGKGATPMGRHVRTLK